MGIHTAVKLLKSRRTKIVVTLGPACDDAKTIGTLMDEGVNIVRLNLSHGTPDSHRDLVEKVRKEAAKRSRPVAILFDIPGPKIRIGEFQRGMIKLVDGDDVTVTTREVKGKPGLIPAPRQMLAGVVSTGSRLMLDDGQVELRVEAVDGTELKCQVIRGGILTNRRGMNLPGVPLPVPSLTDRDRELVRFALEMGADALAQSFVRRAQDVADLRELVDGYDGDTAIIAKIEKSEALDDIDAILEAADGIMVARGDLGVELAPEAVPVAQDQLVDRARVFNKPVIVATQMLDSMTRKTRPTRAEVSDVSAAVKSGVDACMLSGETAVGDHPVAAVDMLDRIIRHTEGRLWDTGAFESVSREEVLDEKHPIWDAMGRATAQLSRDLRVRTIVAVSRTGMTAAMVSAARPAAPILAISARDQTCRRMNLLWGVIPVKVEADELGDLIKLGRRVAVERGLAEVDHRILVVSGYHEVSSLNKPTVSVVEV